MLRILIADDEPLARKVLCEELALHPGVVIVGEAENGADTLAKIAALQPDLVLLDLAMPDISGFAVLQTIQAWNTFPMVVVVTADQEGGKAAVKLGAVDCLHKPVSPSRLFRSLEAIQGIASSGEVGDAHVADNI